MAIPTRPDEFPDREIRLLGDHVRQQRVGGDVERHAEEYVGAALVELAGEPPVGHVELEQQVTRREAHARDLGDVPGADDHAARVRIAAERINHRLHLVEALPVGRGPRAPLRAVHGAELALLVRPLVPDGDAVLAQIADVRVAAQEPEQLVHDRTQVHLLRRHHREAGGQIETHLVAEDAQRARPRPVALAHALIADVPHEVEVGFHPSGWARRA